ncbi:MAG: hypothetical protein R3234_00540 [Thermoanaerobaculia bacterium]|nr:hypothetical protein [Thermoanaerobaculia bacterium]
MSYLFYKILHLVGIFFLFAALGGLTLRTRSGTGSPEARKLTGITHGIALLVVLVSGFGLLARLQVSHGWLFPPWVWGKLLVWLVLGGAMALVKRKAGWRAVFWFAWPVLGALAAWLALYKPGI